MFSVICALVITNHCCTKDNMLVYSLIEANMLIQLVSSGILFHFYYWSLFDE